MNEHGIAVFWFRAALIAAVGYLIPMQSAAADDASTLRLNADDTTGTSVVVSRISTASPNEVELWLLTAYHNIYQKRVVRLTDRNGRSIELSKLTDEPIYVLTSLDIAAVRIGKHGRDWLRGRIRPARLAERLPDFGSGTYAIGNPKIRLLGTDSYPFAYRAEGSIGTRAHANVVLDSRYLEPQVREQELLLINDFTITYGFSGGPLFAKNESADSPTLVGIIQGGDAAQGKIAWATPADSIYESLGKLNAATPIESTLAVSSWPPRGFRGAAYSAIESPARFSVDGWTPKPLYFKRGERSAMELRIHVAAGSGEPKVDREFVIDAVPVPGVEHLGGLEPRGPASGFVSFTHVFRVGEAFAGRRVTIPFVLRSATESTVLSRFEIEGTVLSDDRIEFSLELGAAHVLATELSFGHLLAGVALEWDLGGRGTALAMHVDLGISMLFGERRSFDPVAEIVVEHDPLIALGGRFQLMPELRLWRYRPVGFRVGVGAMVELYGLDTPVWRVGIPLRLAAPIQIKGHMLVPSFVLAYEREPSFDYQYDENPISRQSITGSWEFSLGGGVAYVTTF